MNTVQTNMVSSELSISLLNQISGYFQKQKGTVTYMYMYLFIT